MNARLLGVGLLSAVLVAGCGSEPEQPKTLPPVSAAPSPSESAAPEVPPSAQAETPEGAAAFARFWYDELVAAFDTKDPNRIAALSAPGCTACDTFIASLTSLRDDNERVEVDLEVVAATAPSGESGDTVAVTVIYNSSGSTRYDAGGAVIAEEPARQNAEQTLTLVRAGGTWKVQEVTAG